MKQYSFSTDGVWKGHSTFSNLLLRSVSKAKGKTTWKIIIFILIICSTLISPRHLHGLFIEESECFFCFSWRTVKKEQKSKTLCLTTFQVVPDILMEKENNVKLRSLSHRLEDYSYSSDKHNKRRQEERMERKRETPVLLHSRAAYIHKREARGTRVCYSLWPWLTSPFWEDIWPARSPLLPPLLLHTGLRQLKLAEPVVVMISCG